MYFLTHNGLLIEESLIIDFLRQVKQLCVWGCFQPPCVCTCVFEYLCWFKRLGQHAATVWDSDSYCLLITEATALLVFACGYFAPFDSSAPHKCQ